ncbi:MAG TPA: VRR-NUC domain-containing protein [Gaiellales bacterium]|jgi:hypothetical protein|nr:VRR-NUC domain-containing protein [Gaiellales bacterium]
MSRPTVSEKAFQQSVIQLARLTRWRVFYDTEPVGSPPGWPDLTLCRDGVLLFRELKTDTGRLSPEQRRWEDDLQACGMDVSVWRPRDWPVIEATLKGQLHLEAAS